MSDDEKKIIKVQNLFRKKLANKKVEELKKEHKQDSKKIAKIQAIFRGNKERERI